MSHTPLLASGRVIKRKLNAIRPAESGSPPFSGFLWFFAKLISADGVVHGPPVEEREYFDSFLAAPPSPETYESFPNLTFVDALVCSSNGNAFTTFNDSGLSVIYINAQGRYNTTSGGTQHADIDCTGATPTLSFVFAVPVAAFGLYITDLGEFDATITAVINRTGGGSDSYVISGGPIEKCLTFWGFLDTDSTYDSVVFTIDNTSDRYGIDDIVLALPGQLA